MDLGTPNYATFRRRLAKTRPRPPSVAQIARVEGSGTTPKDLIVPAARKASLPLRGFPEI